MKMRYIYKFGVVVSIAMMLMCLSCLEGLNLNQVVPSEETSETPMTEPEPASLPAGQGLAVGATAPDFTLPDGDGNSYSLSNYAGKILVIQFYSTTT